MANTDRLVKHVALEESNLHVVEVNVAGDVSERGQEQDAHAQVIRPAICVGMWSITAVSANQFT